MRFATFISRSVARLSTPEVIIKKAADMTVESLEGRRLFAVHAVDVGGVLEITGDKHDNTIVVSRNAAGEIFVNGGAVDIKGPKATVAKISLIEVDGKRGNDNIALDETNGALPAASLDGGKGDDTLIGGSANDALYGDAGDDQLFGKGGNDLLYGGDGNDSLTGGSGNDQDFGDAGNDRMIWNPGDGTDVNEGGSGIDTVEVNGGNGAETFTATANGSRVRFDRVTPAPFSLDIGTTENLVLNMNGGDDTFTAGNGLAPLIAITVDGGAGNDTITGGDGNDTLSGGDGNDVIAGGRGNDVALMGAGDDTFIWNSGDGSDSVDGQDGADTMIFNGSAANENISLSANGTHLKLTRDVGAVTMDTNGVETVNVNALGGADNINFGDLSGTAVTKVNLDLGPIPGSLGGDAQADTVTITGTTSADNVQVLGAGTSYTVTGLSTAFNVANSEGALDKLNVNLLDGNDTFNAGALQAGVTQLTVDGGAGNDNLTGSQGNDMLLGGDGNDFVVGGRGNDSAFLGAGDDTFVWNPGDGSDIVEGQAGTDTMLFNGANVSEHIDLSANGTRLRLFRDVANITMDTDGIENVNLNTLGGADVITFNDLSATAVKQVNLDLGASPGNPGGDGQADTVIINGTANADNVQVSGSGMSYSVTGLATVFNVANSEGNLDSLNVNLLGGDDAFDASTLAAGVTSLTVDGGAGNDNITGSQGNDSLLGGDGNDSVIGGRGNDIAFLGAGDDTFTWNPGDGSDIVEGQAGNDTMIFNGSNANEKISIAANGSRVTVFRDVGNITMDVNELENIVVNALGGDDTITAGNGLAALTSLTLDGGTGNDSITGGDGNDMLIGGDGNDLVVGGRGTDVALLGAGDDTFVWNPGDGSDSVEGQDGTDTMLFNGANVSEHIDLSANGTRLRLFRDVGNVTMDTDGIESVNLNTLGGADTITFNDLSATAVKQVNLDLGASPGNPGGDAQADTVIINGTNAADSVQVAGSGLNYSVSGLATLFNVANSEGANDALVVNLLGGDDTFNASGLQPGVTNLTVDGGAGNDILTGSQGADLMIGGDGSDLMIGGRGNDVALMGAGNDTFLWNPGDGSDTVDGQGDSDTMVFNGANINENIDFSANGSHLRLFRDVANITMDVNGVERVNLAALGGADTVTVNDLTGTDVTNVNIDLAATPGGITGDGQADNVIVNGTNNADQILVLGHDGFTKVGGPSAQVTIVGADADKDT
ncbi:MAG TPA: calcium-binding protein, partial [Humisphaera sp.]|nr:calcium-binding protein [Humisphaera sp.]